MKKAFDNPVYGVRGMAEACDVLSTREKAEKHLEKWTKKELISQLSLSAKLGWLEKWAEEYDRDER